MWIKFDGNNAIVRIPEINKERKFPITINKWMQVIETNSKIYVDGKEEV